MFWKRSILEGWDAREEISGGVANPFPRLFSLTIYGLKQN